jgi:hypothetical protein
VTVKHELAKDPDSHEFPKIEKKLPNLTELKMTFLNTSILFTALIPTNRQALQIRDRKNRKQEY